MLTFAQFFSDCLSEIDDKYVVEAIQYQRNRSKRIRLKRAVIAAVLVIAVLGGVVIRSFTGNGGVMVPKAYAVALAEYPDMARYPDEKSITFNADYEAWRADKKKQSAPAGYADDLDGFFAATMEQFLSGAGNENKVYSPLNVYMALAMLAEVTDGNSRAQVLELLNKGDMDALRTQASALWNANYRNDGATTSVLASSLWLNENMAYHEDTVEQLAETYYASTYQGKMGSEEYNQALRDWLNEQTGGLLEEQTGTVSMNPVTVLALATTVYYNARWSWRFSANQTFEEVFHAPGGDVSVPFMHSSRDTNYYWGGQFSAVPLHMENAGTMWLMLPDEGVSVDDLLSDEEVMNFFLGSTIDGGNRTGRYLNVNLSVPKFDVASQLDLMDGLKELGVTDVFSAFTSDFSALTDTDGVYLSKAQHDARVVIDEEGCTAAAYTVMVADGKGAPPDDEVDFVLDRPFLFVLTGIDGLPLFVGVVNQP